MYGSYGALPAQLPANPVDIPLKEAAGEPPSVQVITSNESASPVPPTPVKPTKKERDMVWDNSKLILTVFVATGHIFATSKIYPCFFSWDPHCFKFDAAIAFYSWFHMFEMPGFVFISGYFSRSFVTIKDKTEHCTSTARLKTNLTKIFFVFLTFTLFTTVFNAYDKVHTDYWYVHHTPGKKDGLSVEPFFDLQGVYQRLFPKGITHARIKIWEDTGRVPPVWYMFSLFMWRLAVPYFKIFKRPILVAFVTAYIGAFINWQHAIIARTFGYMPFFILGLCVSKEHVDLIKVPRVQYACTAYLFGMFFVVLYNTKFFYKYVAKVPSDFRGWSNHWECNFYYFWTVSMTFSFFAFVSMTLSNFKGLATNAQNTLYNYLLHYPIMMAVSWFWDWDVFLRAQNPWAQCFYAVLFALGMAVVTTTQITIPVINHKLHVFQWLISPNVHWLFDGSEEVTLENCMGDSSGVCTGHFGLGYVWSVVYRGVKGILSTEELGYKPIASSTQSVI
mmetsp:Transcript_32107/g.70050  ORF Transcript_32107/g.70050 Transcript_32107/m.70050 type:complete len:504 (-) Transcript_32107:83-1594(-)